MLVCTCLGHFQGQGKDTKYHAHIFRCLQSICQYFTQCINIIFLLNMIIFLNVHAISFKGSLIIYIQMDRSKVNQALIISQYFVRSTKF